MGVHVLVHFTPNGLSCHACHLELNGRHEMDAVGMSESFQLDVDEREYLFMQVGLWMMRGSGELSSACSMTS